MCQIRTGEERGPGAHQEDCWISALFVGVFAVRPAIYFVPRSVLVNHAPSVGFRGRPWTIQCSLLLGQKN